jgi:hypothetical protein
MTRWWRHAIPAAAAIVALFFCWWSGKMPAVGNAEWQEPPQEERELIAQAIEEARWVVNIEARPDKLAKRDAHPYAHGCVAAFFVVRPDVPMKLRHGVLANKASYEAWVRFSNGTKRDDTDPDGRGMAIKLMGVPGEKLLEENKGEPTQDFVMLNHHTFFAADVKEYLDFFRHQRKGDDFGYFIGLNPLRWHLFELVTGLEMLAKKPLRSPIDGEYHSMLPFMLGPERIKYSAKPCEPTIPGRCEERRTLVRGHGDKQEPGIPRGPHYLRAALVHDLAFDEGALPKARAPQGEAGVPAARYAFRVQLQKDGFAMPVEDASVTWGDTEASYIPVADIIIPYQEFDSELQNHFCENLSFTPWHSLPEHRPIGGLNRARRQVYEAISRYRHQQNGVEAHEPRGHCLRLDGKPCPMTTTAPAGVRP